MIKLILQKNIFFNLIKTVIHKLKRCNFLLQKTIKIVFRRTNTIFLFGSPFHCNMGDQAQTYCICEWFQHYYPNYKFYIFRLTESSNFLIHLVRKTIRKKDLIVFHSGYHLTDLYHEQDVYCKIVKLFPDFPIIVFPQTINYLNPDNLITTAKIFNNHKNILLMCRDEKSYETAKKNFCNCRLLLYPDIVTSLIGTKHYTHKKEGILFCMRNDIEAFYTKEEINKLANRFKNITIKRTDTTLPIDIKKIYRERKEILEQIFDEYSRYRLVITDRYHGTIFSLVANTPVIVISSTDHKLSSGVKWFPNEFSHFIKFANNLDEAYNLAISMLNDNNESQILPAYFKLNYYDKLQEYINKLINE